MLLSSVTTKKAKAGLDKEAASNKVALVTGFLESTSAHPNAFVKTVLPLLITATDMPGTFRESMALVIC